MNSWDSSFVRMMVGLFWGTFILIVNWSELVHTIQSLKRAHAIHRRRLE
jgi:hypothetical protein